MTTMEENIYKAPRCDICGEEIKGCIITVVSRKKHGAVVVLCPGCDEKFTWKKEKKDVSNQSVSDAKRG